MKELWVLGEVGEVQQLDLHVGLYLISVYVEQRVDDQLVEIEEVILLLGHSEVLELRGSDRLLVHELALKEDFRHLELSVQHAAQALNVLSNQVGQTVRELLLVVHHPLSVVVYEPAVVVVEELL